MSKFRMIKQPSESPLKPTRKRSLLDCVSPQRCETNRGQPSAQGSGQQVECASTWLWAVVVPRHEESKRQPKDKHKDETEQAITGLKEAVRASGKKRRCSESLMPKRRRLQAHREKKLVYSIEHSPLKTSASSTPEPVTDGDYIPSPANLASTALSSSSSTPSRWSTRKHLSGYVTAKSSTIPESTLALSLPRISPQDGKSTPVLSPPMILPQDGSSLAVIKRGISPILKAASPSPSLWSTPTRQKRYEEAGCVQVPKELFEYLKTKNQLAMKETMMAGKQKENEKTAEQKLVKETWDPTQKVDKRKAEDKAEDSKPRKRQKSQKPDTEAYLTPGNSKLLCEESQTSKQISAPRSSKSRTAKIQAQKYEVVAVKADNLSDITNFCSHADMKTKSRSSKGHQNERLQISVRPDSQQHQQPLAQSGVQQQMKPPSWCRAYKSREVIVPEISLQCSCLMLHEHFTRDPSRVPPLETFPGDEHEYFENVKQICFCRGSLHTPYVVDMCKRILEESKNQKRGSKNFSEPVTKMAPGIFSMDGQSSSNMRRAQSSIPPPAFYGNRGKYQIPAKAESSSHLTPEVRDIAIPPKSHSTSRPAEQPKRVIDGSSSSKTLPVQNRSKIGPNTAAPQMGHRPNPAVIMSSSKYLTPQNLSPSDKMRRTDIPSHHHTFDSVPSEQEKEGAKPVSQHQPDTPIALIQPQTPSKAQRRRHQSPPVDTYRRNNAINQSSPQLLPAKQQNANTPQQISRNALLHGLNRTIASLKDLVTQFPAAPHNPDAAAERTPAAAAPVLIAAAQDVNATSQPFAMRVKKKYPSVAEQKLKKPVLTHNVPPHLRLSDEAIIEVGRLRSSYDRHERAPYAFSWYGCLTKEYEHLLVRTVDGAPVWTARQIRRILR